MAEYKSVPSQFKRAATRDEADRARTDRAEAKDPYELSNIQVDDPFRNPDRDMYYPYSMDTGILQMPRSATFPPPRGPQAPGPTQISHVSHALRKGDPDPALTKRQQDLSFPHIVSSKPVAPITKVSELPEPYLAPDGTIIYPEGYPTYLRNPAIQPLPMKDRQEYDFFKERLKRNAIQTVGINLKDDSGDSTVMFLKNMIDKRIVDPIERWINSDSFIEFGIRASILSIPKGVEPLIDGRVLIPGYDDVRLRRRSYANDEDFIAGAIQAYQDPQIKVILNAVFRFRAFRITTIEIIRDSAATFDEEDDDNMSVLKNIRFRFLYNEDTSKHFYTIPPEDYSTVEARNLHFARLVRYIPPMEMILLKVMIDECISGLPVDTPHIIHIDLFRDRTPERQGGLHNDSSYYPDIVLGNKLSYAENVSRVSLLMLNSNPDTIYRGTTVGIDPFRVPGLVPSTMSVAMIGGCNVTFENTLLMHATPFPQVPRTDERRVGALDNGPQISYLIHSNRMTETMSPLVRGEIESPSNRTFLRSQCSKRPTLDYIAVSNYDGLTQFAMEGILISLSQPSVFEPSSIKIVTSIDELNEAFEFISKANFTIGGKKTLKKKKKSKKYTRKNLGRGATTAKLAFNETKPKRRISGLKELDLNKIFGKNNVLDFTKFNNKNVIIKINKSNIYDLSKYETGNTIIY